MARPVTSSGSQAQQTLSAASNLAEWDNHFNDPTADIILVSKDNVRFRAHRWFLKKDSAYVTRLCNDTQSAQEKVEPVKEKQTPRRSRPTRKSTLAEAMAMSSQRETGEETRKQEEHAVENKATITIPLDFTSAVINTYLTMVYSGHKVQPTSDFSFEHMEDLVKLCERLEAATFVDLFRIAMTERPWPALLRAAQTRDVRLARDAISRFNDDCPLAQFPSDLWLQLKDIPPEWLYEIMRLRVDESGGSVIRKDWMIVATAFSGNG